MSTEFIDFCRSRGVLIDQLPPLGVWKRYKTSDKDNSHRNGAVKWLGDHGLCQNHATMTEVDTWHADKDAPAYVMSAAMQAQIEASKARERQRRIDGMAGARVLWNRSDRLLGGHPYLTRKGLTMQGCTGLRLYDGNIVVPMHQGEVLLSVQQIDAGGDKKFFPGAPVKSCYYSLLRQRAAVTAFCEGLSTGLAIFQSVEQANVVICFNASNMVEVAKVLKPTGSVVWCADNDHGTFAKRGFNPGLDAARSAAALVGGGVAYPESIEGTDFADLLKEYGIGGHKKVSREILKHAQYVA